MRELTIRQMSETDGGIGFRAFFNGFLCGASLFAVFAITPTTSVFARAVIYTTAIGVCGSAFAV